MTAAPAFARNRSAEPEWLSTALDGTSVAELVYQDLGLPSWLRNGNHAPPQPPAIPAIPSRESVAEPEAWTADSLLSHDFGPTRYIVDPLVPVGGIWVSYGNRESGKTSLYFSMLHAMAGDSLLLGRYRCTPARTTLVEVDMTPRLLQERVRMASAGGPLGDGCQFLTPRTLDLLRAQPSDEWVQRVRDHGTQFLVFDSLRKIHRLKEVDTEAPSLLYGKCKDLFPGCTFGFLHHVRKAPQMPGLEYDAAADSESYRGTTAWLDDSDSACHLHHNLQRGTRSFRITRCRTEGDHVKNDMTAFSLNEETLLCEPTEPTAEMQLLAWRTKHPDATKADARDFVMGLTWYKDGREHPFSRAAAYRVVDAVGGFTNAKPGRKAEEAA